MPTVVIAALLALAAPVAAAAQTGIGVGLKVGTIGVGPEVAMAIGERLALRGGGSFLPVSPSATFSEMRFEVDLPATHVNLGADLYLLGPLRLSGGLLLKGGDTTIRATFAEPQEVGGRTYTPEQIGTLVGSVESGSTAPFAMLGLGRHARSGVGVYLDLGASFVPQPSLTLRAEGGTLTGPERAEFDQRLEEESRRIEEDLGDYLRLYPILQLGLRIGLGG